MVAAVVIVVVVVVFTLRDHYPFAQEMGLVSQRGLGAGLSLAVDLESVRFKEV